MASFDFCCPNIFINNDIRPCGLSQHVAISVTEVSDVDFTEAVLMLVLY